MSLHKRDIDVLKMIKQKLNNIGTIYEYEIKPDARLAVNDVPSLLYLIQTVFQEFALITKNQYIRYLIFKYGLLNNIKEFKTLEQYNLHMSEILSSISIDSVLKDRVEKLFENNDLDNWIIGFINGEGCFFIKNGKCGFIIEHTDRQALEIIKRRLSFGPNVLERSPRLRDIGKPRKTTYQLVITSEKDIGNLVSLLDNKENIPLQGNKYTQYIEWKQSFNSN